MWVVEEDGLKLEEEKCLDDKLNEQIEIIVQ